MKKFFKEFSDFINKGSVIDLAIGVIIGGAFQSIITSFVNDIIMPIFSLIFGGLDFSAYCIKLGQAEDAASINYGTFITAIINFLLMALVIFMIIKPINKMKEEKEKKEQEKAAKEAESKEATTKICPYCKSEIDINATRCPHCTSNLED